jgi:hypothetical protein
MTADPTFASAPAAELAPPPALLSASAGPLPKIPWLAFALGGFPGIGHIYNGLYVRGLTFFAICGSLIALASREGFFGFAVAFFWIFNMLDSYRQAVLINYGYSQDLGLSDLPARPAIAQGGLAAGLVLLAIGVVALLDHTFHVDLSFLFDFWPVGLILVGGWMVGATLRQRMKARDALSAGSQL